MPDRFKKLAAAAVVVLLIGIAFYVLKRQMADLTWQAVMDAVKAIAWWRIGLAFLGTCVSVACLAAYDVAAARAVVPGYRRHGLAAFAGAAGNVISNTLGFNMLTGGALRYRIYSTAGVGLADAARITTLATAGIGMAFVFVIAGSLTLSPGSSYLSAGMSHGLGWGTLAAIACFLLWAAVKPRRIGWNAVSFPVPGATVLSLLLVIGVLETAAAVFSFYILLPDSGTPPIAQLTLYFLGGAIGGIISQSPSGVGVFEVTMTTALAVVAKNDLAAAFLVYRLVYNIVPFILACLSVFSFEVRAGVRKGKDSTPSKPAA